jgi:hypothetical protein
MLIDGGETTTTCMEYAQESKALTSVCVGHALARCGNVATRRVVTSGGEAGEGEGEMCR